MRRVSRAAPPKQRRGGAVARLYRAVGWLAVPALVAVGVAGAARSGIWPPPVERIMQQAEAWLIDRSAAVGLRVADIRVEGRGTTDRATILAALGAGLGTPILAVDPVRAEKRLEALPWVSAAVIERHLPDTLYVRLVERTPLALWQHEGKVQLIDAAGAIIPVTRLHRFAKLTLVVGSDAASHAAQLRAMLAKEPDLDARVTAAVRVGGRRWNLRIDGRIEVLLPADDPEGAVAALARLERSSAILDRDVQAVDMRLADRLVVRVSPPATKEAAPAPGKGRQPARNI
jgi:cell division protein FtsQ